MPTRLAYSCLLLLAIVAAPRVAGAAEPQVEIKCVAFPGEPTCTFTNVGGVPASACATIQLMTVKGASTRVCSGRLDEGEQRSVPLEFPDQKAFEACAAQKMCAPIIRDSDVQVEGVRKWLFWLKVGGAIVAAIALIVSGLYWQRKTSNLIRAGRK